MLVTLPFVLLLLDYWPLQRWPAAGAVRADGRALIREKGPFFLLAAISCLVTFSAQAEKAVIPLQQMPLGFRLENAVVAVAAYLGNTLWPAGLGIFYPLPAAYSAAAVAASAVLVAGLSLLVWCARRHRCLVTGWLWFLGMLVPVIGLVQAGEQARADRYTYLPSVGLFVAVVFGLAGLRGRWKIPARAAGVAAVLILGACVAVTEHQLAFWRDTETLYQHTLAVTRNNGMTHMLLGSFYEKQGRSDEARQQYHEALDCFALIMVEVDGEKRPYTAQVYLLFGQSAEQKGQTDEAIEYYREALRLDDKLVEAHNNLGNLLDQQGRSAEALAEYQAAVRLKPQTPLVHENLGTQLAEMGRWDEAMSEYQAAARLAPADPRPAYLTGKAWLRQGRSRDAAGAFENALRLDPADVQSLVYLARLLASDASPQLRNGARAVALAEQANTLTGGNQPFVLGTLAMAYAEAGRFADARQTARTALQLAGDGADKTTAALQAQLRLYEAGQPYREVLANAPGPASGK
jgi:tetratricopeptide (TPR) repeat protein